ncbi:MAG TPA: spore germination protein GerW family protein [Ktedonobacteraceae bacterium]|nr:spore germination protein GerW family protein [Ktedonobacteraceae bacterium]
MSIQVDIQPERTYAEQYASALEHLDRKMEHTADAAVAFASPHIHGGLMIIPVAKVRSSAGSGFGTIRPKEPAHMQGGVGMGETTSVTPVGYIEVNEGTARFRPIFTPDAMVKVQIVGGLLALLTFAGLGPLLGRRAKKNGRRRRGSVFNAVFSPGAHIQVGTGRALKRRRGFRSQQRLNRQKCRASFPHPVRAAGRLSHAIRLLRMKHARAAHREQRS